MMNTDASPRVTLITFAVLILMIGLGGVLLLISRPQPVEIVINPPQPTVTPPPTGTPGPMTVYVTGAVNRPQSVISLPPDSRVQDALDFVGGPTEDADMARVNLAGLLRDGDQVHVPTLPDSDNETAADATRPQSQLALATPSGGDLVSVNRADVEALQALPGIGPALAQRIIDHREANGPFNDLSDLDAVSGIGPAILENIGPLVVFE